MRLQEKNKKYVKIIKWGFIILIDIKGEIMWIRSQDKKELVNVIKIEIFGDKNGKAVIWGQFTTENLFSTNKVSLGSYSTVDEAIKEINEIEKSIIENPNGVYHMRSNK